jgi:hypothetical protein
MKKLNQSVEPTEAAVTVGLARLNKRDRGDGGIPFPLHVDLLGLPRLATVVAA